MRPREQARTLARLSRRVAFKTRLLVRLQAVLLAQLFVAGLHHPSLRAASSHSLRCRALRKERRVKRVRGRARPRASRSMGLRLHCLRLRLRLRLHKSIRKMGMHCISRHSSTTKKSGRRTSSIRLPLMKIRLLASPARVLPPRTCRMCRRMM